MKLPADCENLSEIRTEIDELDKQIIERIKKRFEYVKSAAKFKTSVATVQAPERFASMLETRKKWATQNGLQEEWIEKIYTLMVNFFIEEEIKEWKNSIQS